MMSRAFKVFLLMILFFGALWAYRFRARDLRSWLEFGEPPPLEADQLSPLRSPVERVLDPRNDALLSAVLSYRRPEPQPEEFSSEGLRAADFPTPTAPAPLAPAAPAPPAAVSGPAVAEEEPPVPIVLRRPAVPPPAEPSARERGRPRQSSLAEVRTPEPPRRRTVSHVVQKKETLASLARKYYQNDTERWRAIFEANQERISDPDNLPLGTVLVIPEVEPDRPPPVAPPGGARPSPRGAGSGERAPSPPAPASRRRAGPAGAASRGERELSGGIERRERGAHG